MIPSRTAHLPDDDCGTCKDQKYVVTVIGVPENINLPSILTSIPELGFTEMQANIIAKRITESTEPYRVFTAKSEYCFKVIDKLLEHKINCSISKLN